MIVRESSLRLDGFIGQMENNWRILLAESHPQLRQNMVKTLTEMPGLNLVARVSNGWDVMFTSSQLKPDVILMDYSLPGLTGVEATRLIRRGLPQIQVIMLLGDGENDDRHITASEQCGASACLLKSQLVQELPALLGRMKRITGERDTGGK